MATAIAVSQAAYPGFPVCPSPSPGQDPDGPKVPCETGGTFANMAVLVRADDYADALAAAPLAEQRSGPILLTYPDRLHPATAEELRRLIEPGAGLEQVVLLGGTRALRPEVEQQVRDLGIDDVRRVFGADRFQTAAELARALVSTEPLGADPSSPPYRTDTMVVARGSSSGAVPGWPDALSAAALATWLETPLLLVEKNAVPPPTADTLRELGVRRVVIVGGVAAVSPEVETELGAIVAEVTRIGGTTRYDTSRLAADQIIEGFGSEGEVAYPSVVTGRDWPDAVAAAPPVNGRPLILIDGQDLARSPETRDWLDTHADEFRGVQLVGGSKAITPEVEEALRALLRP